MVTDRADWANGVLLRAVALPDEPERIAAGPGLLARRFGLDRRDDSRPVTGEHDMWMAPRSDRHQQDLVTTTRIGISQGAAPHGAGTCGAVAVSAGELGVIACRKAQCWSPCRSSRHEWLAASTCWISPRFRGKTLQRCRAGPAVSFPPILVPANTCAAGRLVTLFFEPSTELAAVLS